MEQASLDGVLHAMSFRGCSAIDVRHYEKETTDRAYLSYLVTSYVGNYLDVAIEVINT